MSGDSRRVPLADGTTLYVGPSNVGKTTATARALDRWTSAYGEAGVVVLDFAPTVERDGTVLGGRLDRFTTVPTDVFHGVLDAHAPRTDAGSDGPASDDEVLALARDNAERARGLFERAPPDPTAVFVNDATIPFQADGATDRLRAYCEGARVVIANALETDELGTDDPVSRNERAALAELRAWADRVVELGERA